jgi:hypothetical protein
LVQQPTPKVIREFGQNFQDQIPTHGDEPILLPADIGKFVAAHTVLLIAPFPHSIAHGDIIKGRPDLSDEIKAALVEADAQGIPRLVDPLYGLPTKMTDAGYFTISHDTMSVTLFDRSGDFGRADQQGRARTVEAFRQALDGLDVKNGDEED